VVPRALSRDGHSDEAGCHGVSGHATTGARLRREDVQDEPRHTKERRP
jgi:hypothetical protein